MELMDGVMEYIRPELLVLVAVLYIVGKALKASQDVKDKHIPLILGGAGVFLAMLWDPYVEPLLFQRGVPVLAAGALAAFAWRRLGDAERNVSRAVTA